MEKSIETESMTYLKNKSNKIKSGLTAVSGRCADLIDCILATQRMPTVDPSEGHGNAGAIPPAGEV